MKSGFISIVGKPNVGKSTLLNQIIKKHVSIVSEKPETTRFSVIGIYNDADYQLVFTDTPGFDKYKHLLNRRSDSIATKAIGDADIVLYVVDRKYMDTDSEFIERLDENIPTILIINKIDLLETKADIDEIIVSYLGKFDFCDYVPVSSTNNIHIDKLIEIIKSKCVDETIYYPPEMTFALSLEGYISELIREQLMINLNEEIPHATGVVIESLTDIDDNEYECTALIILERENHKNIVIGKGGSLIKKIRQNAEKRIKMYLGLNVYLDLYVKVIKDWRNKPHILDSMGISDKWQLRR